MQIVPVSGWATAPSEDIAAQVSAAFRADPIPSLSSEHRDTLQKGLYQFFIERRPFEHVALPPSASVRYQFG